MNKIFLLSFFLVFSSISWAADFFAIKYNTTIQKNEIWRVNTENSTETKLAEIRFPSNGWQTSASFLSEKSGEIYMKNAEGYYNVYNPKTNTFREVLAEVTGYQKAFEIPDKFIDDIIAVKNGAVHIGENSLVTKEENGKQSLSAQDANGDAIDINITNGSNLLINGKPITAGVSIKEVRKYDSRSVALSAALTSLPTQSIDGSHACGIGSGVRGNYSAMALGCAADLDKIKLFDNAPLFIRNASINLGTSFLTHDDPDYTFKAGLTWNFGKSKAKTRNLSKNDRRDIRSTIAEQKNALAINKLQKDNRVLKESNMELTRKLNSLIVANQRFVSLASKMELLAQQIESSELVLASK